MESGHRIKEKISINLVNLKMYININNVIFLKSLILIVIYRFFRKLGTIIFTWEMGAGRGGGIGF